MVTPYISAPMPPAFFMKAHVRGGITGDYDIDYIDDSDRMQYIRWMGALLIIEKIMVYGRGR